MRNVVISVAAGILMCAALAHGQESKEEIKSLPNDFAVAYSDDLIGVVPSENTYIDITRNRGASDGSCTIVTGILGVFGGRTPTTKTPMKTKRLTKEQCLAFYKDAVKTGFFELNSKYSGDQTDTGYGVTFSITADGETKTVKTINRQVPEIIALITKLQKLLK